MTIIIEMTPENTGLSVRKLTFIMTIDYFNAYMFLHMGTPIRE